MKEMEPRNSVVGTQGAELEPEPTRDTVLVAEELEPMVPGELAQEHRRAFGR